MTITYFFLTLNHHEAPVVDELYKLIGNNLTFVELVDMSNREDLKKGSSEDLSSRFYLLKAWESPVNEQKAMELARTSDVAMFCGYPSLKYQIERLKANRLSFEVSERWLKRGLYGIMSPRLMEVFLNYYIRNWRRRPLYRLCSSAFAATDHAILGMYKGKCYKWGYFTEVNKTLAPHISIEPHEPCTLVRLMWCARFIDWKHPELPIRLAVMLKDAGYKFHLDMYGDGILKSAMEGLSKSLGVRDYITFYGNIPNEQIRQAMRANDIFLFTSDRQEGWGAVANEAMSEGCVIVGSDEIGAVPYLVKHKETGMIFRSRNLESLYEQVIYLMENPGVRRQISEAGQESMVKIWSPKNAAKSLLQLIEDIQAGRESSIMEGPCSKA